MADFRSAVFYRSL